MINSNIKNKKITIIGCGIRGIGAANLAAQLGAKVFISDIKKIDKKNIIHNNIKFESGKHSEKCFNCDFAIKSPGINNNSEIVKKLLKYKIPIISATKSQTGHGLGAAGSNESIYSLLMLENDFVAESINISEIDPDATDVPIARNRIDNAKLKTVMSNSFGFGGTNATLVFEKV